MLGATRAQLRSWGYGDIRPPPSVDGRIDQCVAEVGPAQTECWAALDKYLMERVVPWAPFLFQTAVRTVSARIAHYSLDQSTGLPALDQIAFKPSAIRKS
jgi:hypothetical protein